MTLLAYFPVINGQFVWDDHSLVQGNRFIRSPLMLGEMFTHHLHLGSPNSYYRPVQNVSFLLDYLIWGENPLGFHLSNILLQAVCGWLLYQLLRQLLPVLLEASARLGPARTDLIALLVALLWVIHPIHNAAVAYISGRADPLSFAFSAAAVCLVLASRKWAGTWKQPALLACAWLLGLVALCTRESAACWMMLLALYLCFFEHKYSRRACGVTIVALLVLLGSWLLLRQLPAPITGGQSPDIPTGPERIVLIFRALGDYSRLLVAPVTLTMERRAWPEWRQVPVTWTNFPLHFGWLGCVGVVVLILAIVGALWRNAGQRLRIFGAAWFVLCFLPISNLFPLNAQVAEHWMYLASVGALLFVAGLVACLPEKWLRRSAVIVTVGFIPLLMLRTSLRAGEWADPIRFYSQTLRVTGGNPRVINNLAMAYRQTGDMARAEQIYRIGLQRYPNYSILLGNLGKLLASQGRTEEAEALLKKAEHFGKEQTHIARSAWRASVAMGSIKLGENQPKEVLARLKSAREETPEDWDLMQNYCDALEKVEGAGAVIPELEKFAQQQWWYVEPRLVLSRKWLAEHEPEKALHELHHAARLDVWDARPYAEIASIELERKHLPEALKAQRSAVRRAPKDPKQRAALAYVLHELGREEEATAEFQKFKQLEQAAAQRKG
ncbi:tetratricopeptide repeat protein [Verrucomicrobiota bacterium sgz303538]